MKCNPLLVLWTVPSLIWLSVFGSYAEEVKDATPTACAYFCFKDPNLIVLTASEPIYSPTGEGYYDDRSIMRVKYSGTFSDGRTVQGIINLKNVKGSRISYVGLFPYGLPEQISFAATGDYRPEGGRVWEKEKLNHFYDASGNIGRIPNVQHIIKWKVKEDPKPTDLEWASY